MKRSRASLRPIAAAGMALLLTSCATGPRYQPPQIAVPENWAADDADAQWPSLDWWTAFNDPVLNGLVSTTLQNNHDLKAAVERVAQARAQMRIANAALFPAISADAEIARQKSSNNSPEQRVREPLTSYQVGLTASYELDIFGKNHERISAAAAALTGSRFDRQAVALSITAITVSTYFQLSALEARIDVAKASLAAARKTLDLVRAQESEGRATTLEIAQQSAEVARLEAALPQLQTQRDQSRNALSILAGILPERFQLAATPIGQLVVPATPAGLPSALLRHRPDVLRAEAALASANANVRAASAALFPHIELTGQGGFASLALGQLFNPGNLFYNLAAGLAAPLFDGGRLKGEVALNEAKYRELTENYQKAVLSAFTDVENALSAQSNAALTVAARRTAVEQAAEANRIAKLQLREGMADYLAVLETQRALLSAEDAEVQSRLDQLNVKVSIYQALGGGWGIDAEPSKAGRGNQVRSVDETM